jgi:hypothetical protein
VKLAEALIIRVDLQKQIISLKDRLMKNSKVQDGEQPAENPEELLKELDECIVKLEDLIKRINRTNSITLIDDKNSISDIIAEKDCLAQRIKVLKELSNSATISFNRYSRNEIKVYSTIDVTNLQKDINKLSKKYRELDTKLQQTNWTINLV